MREALFELLEVAGLAPRAFSGAAAFLTGYAPGDIDLLITDVRMPGIDGLELQDRVGVIAPTLPVIFITGSSDPETKRRALTAGAYAYLSKPVGDIELMSTLWSALAGQPSPGT